MKTLDDVIVPEETQCACETCVSCCQRPCWGTPAEAQRLIDAGLGDRLQNDWWCADHDIDLLCPASQGSEGDDAPEYVASGLFGWLLPPVLIPCTFLTADGRCELHALGLKPLEGRVAYHDGPHEGVHEAIAQAWDNDDARALVERWRRDRGLTEQRCED